MQGESAILQYNKQAMEELRSERFDEALKYLLKCQELLFKVNSRNIFKLQAMTYNNFGCYYKAINKPEAALNYLSKALSIEKSQELDTSNIAGTHLNICAIFSQIGSHDQALSHAVTALKLLRNSCNTNNLKNITTLIIALHNTGIEYEHLSDIEKAASTFKYGLELAQQYLGNKHQYTTALLKSFLSITTTEKKYYFEKSQNPRRASTKRPQRINESFLPNVTKYHSQEHSPTRFLMKDSKGFLSSGKDKGSGKVKAVNRTLMQTAEELAPRQELPSIDKPHTFGGVLKKNPQVEKVIHLEEKLNFLQSQLVGFEKRYKALEEKSINTTRRASEGAGWKKGGKGNLRSMEKAAVVIQRSWRRYKQRVKEKAVRNKGRKDMKGVKGKIVKIDPVGGGYVKKGREEEAGRSKIGEYELHTIAEAKAETKRQKAVLIQAHVRRFLQQKRYRRMRTAAIKIQSFVKRQMVYGLFKSILLAIRFIQRQWREYRLKKLGAKGKFIKQTARGVKYIN